MFSLYVFIQVVKATLEQLARMRSLSQRRWFMTFPFAFLIGMDALGFIQENVQEKKYEVCKLSEFDTILVLSKIRLLNSDAH